MKFTISPRLGENEEALNIIIKNFTELILKGTLEEKQKFLVDNGLASYEEVNNEPPMPDPTKAGDPPTVDLSNPVQKGGKLREQNHDNGY
jgi:hypothetical protein